MWCPLNGKPCLEEKCEWYCKTLMGKIEGCAIKILALKKEKE